jgi:hypothetical protein
MVERKLIVADETVVIAYTKLTSELSIIRIVITNDLVIPPSSTTTTFRIFQETSVDPIA